MAAENSPWLIAGRVTRKRASHGLAPQRIAASSTEGSKVSSAPEMVMIEKGSATIRCAMTKPTSVPFSPSRRKAA